MKEKWKTICNALFVYREDVKGLKVWGIVLALIFFVASAGFLSNIEASAKKMTPLAEVEVFKTLDLATLDGERFTAAELAEYDIIVVDMWTTWCFHCVEEMPTMAKFSDSLEKTFPESKVLYLGIVNDVYDPDGTYHEDLLATARTISQKAGVHYPQLIGDVDFLNDFVGPYVDGFPTLFYLDGEGNVLDTTNALDTNGYILKIKALLEGQKGAEEA